MIVRDLRSWRFIFYNMETTQLYRIFRESNGISTDTRSVTKGQMFFALWGEKFNGNKYAAEALEKGASYAVIDDPAFESEKTILVDDCLAELQALATHHRKELNVPVLAITGTNGKTTTKELIAAVMSKKLKAHYTKGNLNNQIGVPLTILSAPPATEMMIIEMGANHIGEIRTLCLIAKPDYGIITNVGSAHIEGFGSADGVVRTKIELYEYLRKVNGVAIYDDKNPLLTEKIYKIVNRAVPYSDPTGIDLKVDVINSDMNLSFTATYHNKTYNVRTNLFGYYNIENVKAAIATGLFLGVDIEDILNAIENYQPGNNRSQLKKTEKNTLICDSYNANPTSMNLSLKSFDGIKAENKIVILGDMLELGEKSEEEHTKILDTLETINLESVFLVGPEFGKLAADYGFLSFLNIEQLRDHIRKNPLSGKHILIKGSRGMTLEKIYDLL